MTLFQKNCLEVLKDRLSEKRLELESLEEKQGQTELFIQGKVGKTLFWIYEDMADLKLDERHMIFEPPDYESSRQLIESFVETIVRSVLRDNAISS
jgi:hypothetical protein